MTTGATVHLMNGANGRPSGLAYVELSSEEDQTEAVRRDKNSIGGRYIDVFACTQNELQARLAGGLERGGAVPLPRLTLSLWAWRQGPNPPRWAIY